MRRSNKVIDLSLLVSGAYAHGCCAEARQAQEALQAEREKSDELQKSVQQLQKSQAELSQKLQLQNSSISSLEAERNTLRASVQQLNAALASMC